MTGRVLVPGHALVDGNSGGEFAAECSCGETSDCLSSCSARRRWHKDHKEKIVRSLVIPVCPVSCGVEDVAWAAGLFEGEGCFYTQISTAQGRRYQYPRATLSMVDLDVVEKFMEVVGVGRIKPRKDKKRLHPDTQLQHEWKVDATHEVHHVAFMFLPFFGERRTKQVNRVLNAKRGRLP